MPTITLPAVPQGTPFVSIPWTGDHIDFPPLAITFKVDEDMENYFEIFNWIIGQGFPDTFDQYKTLAANKSYTGLGIESDLTVFIQTAAKNPKFNCVFYDAFPTQLSGFKFDTTNQNVEYVNVTATFRYRRFEFLNV